MPNHDNHMKVPGNVRDLKQVVATPAVPSLLAWSYHGGLHFTE